ncbi:hypothetical protein H4Q26_002950 [Puccinia striiformis f. sp. tritici PST-130]|nr:hypothetical protein H4Q26_002950 [Puccinia striiformis f. sp. tritici PST-130]
MVKKSMQQGGERIEEEEEERQVESEVGEEDPTSTSAEAAKNTLLRRSTRATSKTPAETSIGKEPKKTTKKGKEQASSALKQAESATIRELLGASLAKGTGTGRKPDEERTHAKVTALLIHHLANDLVNTERELARQTENQSNKRTNLATVLDLAVKALLAGDTAQANRLFDFRAAFGAEAKEKRNELGEEQMASIGTSYTLREGWDTASTGKPFEGKETNTGRRGTSGQNNQQTTQQLSQQPASRQDIGKAPTTNGYRGNRFNPRHNDRDRKDVRRGNAYNRDCRDDRGGKGYNT